MSIIDRELESTIPDDEIKENIDYMLHCRSSDDYNGFQIMCRLLMRHPVLPREEEQRLLQVATDLSACDAQAGGGSSAEKLRARDTLLLYNQRLVFDVAKRYKFAGCLTIEDLIQEGSIGLIKAIEHFDLSKGAKFSTYAVWWVRQAITRAIEETGDTIRKPGSTHSFYKRLQKIREQLKRFTGGEPTYEDLAEASGLKLSFVKDVLNGMQLATSLDKPLFDDNDVQTVLNSIPDDGVTPADIVSERVFDEQLEALISSNLDEKEAQIIKRGFGLFGHEEETLSEIGKDLGISRERVRQIKEEILFKIKEKTGSDDEVDLAEAFIKMGKRRKDADLKRERCEICGKKLPELEWKYCSDQCRRRVIYEQRRIDGKDIRAKRKALMLSQRQLAAKIGVTKQTIGAWERGVTKPDFENFEKLTGFFDKHASEISRACRVTGDFLRDLRESYGLSQRQFAKILGVSTVTVGNWERNCHEPDFSYQKKLRSIANNPGNITEEIPPRKCVICGKVLPPRAKKYCRNECRMEGEAAWEEKYRENAREQKAKEIAKAQANQLTLFDVSDYTKSEPKRRMKQKRRHKSVGTENPSKQLSLW